MKRMIEDKRDKGDKKDNKNMGNNRDGWDPSLTADLDLSDTEVAELTRQVDLGRIWEATALRIQREETVPGEETAPAAGSARSVGSAQSAGSAPSPGACRRLNRQVRRLAAAAVLILCLGCAVFAVQKGYFETFFGIDPLSDSQILRVNSSQTSDGIRMTLAEVIPGETDGVLTVAFERTDGSSFPENVELAEFNVLLDGKTAGGMEGKQLSDDKKQLLYCIELDGREIPIKGKTLTVEAGTLYSIDEQEIHLENSGLCLQDGYDARPIHLSEADMERLTGAEATGDREGSRRWYSELGEQMKLQTASTAIADIQLSDAYPAVRFPGVAIGGGNLYLSVSLPEEKLDTAGLSIREQNALQNKASVSGLLDTRTQETALWSRQRTSSADGLHTVFSSFERKTYTEEDLAYLIPVITYEDKELISRGHWSLSYTFDESLTKNLKTDIVESMEEGTVQITDARISVMGVNLYGQWLEHAEGDAPYRGYPPYRPEVKAVLKDGSEIELTWNQSLVTDATGGYFRHRYIWENQDGQDQERRFIDQELMDTMAGISVDGTLIPLE